MKHRTEQLANASLEVLTKATLVGVISATLVAGIGADEASAENIQWGPDTPIDYIVYDWSSDGGQTVNYTSRTVLITDTTTGKPITDTVAWSSILIANVLGGYAIVGEINGVGTNATGFFSIPWSSDEYNITNVFTSAPSYVSGVDVNGDGIYGTLNNETGSYQPEPGEYFGANLTLTYDNSTKTFDMIAYYTAPEQQALTLAIAGMTTETTSSTNVFLINVQATPLNCRFYLHVSTNLLATNWSDAIQGGCIATGTVTTVTCTNVAPKGFYRVSSMPADVP